MKQVTIENVRERIERIKESKMIMGRQARLSMNTEFELACMEELLKHLICDWPDEDSK